MQNSVAIITNITQAHNRTIRQTSELPGNEKTILQTFYDDLAER